MPLESLATTTSSKPGTPDFSLVLGGPLFQIYRRARLSGDALELATRRILVISLFAWLPLAILSLVEGHAFRGADRIPFLYDVEAYARFLVALPVLIGAELVVHRRVSPCVAKFVERHIVTDEDMPQFNGAVHSALRIRNSVTAEMALIFFVYTLGLWLWRNQIALGNATWYGTPSHGHLNLTLAGYWYRLVSIPILQFILLRWYLRLAIWFRLLWRISRLNLQLSAAHPDRSGGIRFLGGTSYAFGPLLFAQGALLSGVIGNRVLFEGRGLVSFKLEAAGLIVGMVSIILGPLLMFAPKLELAKRKGAADYGLLASCYIAGFERKWIRGGSPDMDELLGTGDIQSLADLGNSYSVVQDMRWVPFGISDITRLVATTAAPMIPLGLTVFSLEDLVKRLIKIVL